MNATTLEITGQANLAARPNRDYTFYLIMAISSVLMVFLGFSRSYYLKGIFHTAKLPVLFHIHGAVFSTWMVFFVAQIWLIKDGRPKIHRQMGYAGAVLASLMVILGVTMAFVSARMGNFNKIPGAKDPAEACLFSLFDISLFGFFVWAGFFWRRNRQAHQRFMIFGTIVAFLPSAIGRLCNFHPEIAMPIIFAFFLAGPIYDLFTRRRIHWAYAMGLGIVVITAPPLRILIGRTEAWHSIFHSLAG